MRRLKWWAMWGVLLVAPATAQPAGDVLYLQDGRERVGELVEISGETVIFAVDGEPAATTFPLGDVERIELAQARAGDDIRSVAELEDPLIKRLVDSAPGQEAYPDSGYVVLHSLKEYTLGDDGSYRLRERRVEKVLLERGKRRANVARYFKSGEETLEIDFARTINPDGSITPISDAAVDITSVNAGTPEYEKLQQVKFAMKQLREGSVLDYQITKRRPVTDLLNPLLAGMYFRGREPILEAELRIISPSGLDLSYQADRLGDNVQFTKNESGGQVVHRWVGRDCPRVVPESLMPPAGDLYPRVTVAVKTTWEAVGNAYRGAMVEAAKVTPQIKEKVRQLTADAGDPEERARRIFNYFTEEIRQLWISPDEYSYAPRPVGEVFARLAGNTTDKAVLLAVMLQEAGLPANVVLACPTPNGKLVESVPCIKQLDDAVVAVTLPPERQFLPLDNDSARFGQMPREYQGTRGLLISPEGCTLVTIPLNAPERERSAAEYRMKVMPSGDLTVTKTETLTGNHEIARRAAWKNQKDEELRRELEVALTAIHPKARLDSYKVENLHDLTKPVTFTETYTLEDYAMRAGEDLLVFRLPEIRYDAALVGKPEREFPLRWPSRGKSIVDLTLDVPPEYKVYYAGKDYQADAGVADFVAKFAEADGQIRYRDRYVQRETEAPPEAYGEYKSCLETRARVAKEWIVLERVAD